MITTIITTIVVYAIADAAASLAALHIIRKHRPLIAARIREYLGVHTTSPYEVIARHEAEHHGDESETYGDYEESEEEQEDCEHCSR